MKSILLAVGLCGLAITSQVNATLTLEGKTVELEGVEQNKYGHFTVSFGTAVVGSDVEFPNAGGLGTEVNISDSQISVRYLLDHSTVVPSDDFYGARLGLVDDGFVFTSLTWNSGSNTTVDTSKFWIDDKYLYFNNAGVTQNPGDYAIFNVGIAAVPEPSNYVAGVSALAMLFFGWRNRK